MSVANKPSEPNMEPTSKSAPTQDRRANSHQTSEEYLAGQITDARIALEATLDDLTLDVARVADLRRWIRRYPWLALGSAVVAGFTVAHLVTNRRQNSNAAANDE